MKTVNNLIAVWKKYRFLLNELIARDFKVKYKRSVLGVAWSLLYPILMMGVLAVVFSNVFRSGMPQVNYLVYLLVGLTFYNFLSESTNQSMTSVITNFSLINKVYIPKYIFPLAKCLSAAINFLLTLIPLYAVILITGTGLNWYHFLLPYSWICLFAFALGMGLLLSAATVFMRDVIYIYGIVLMLWMYLTPIMYDMSMLGNGVIETILRFNPLFQYIDFARCIILYDRCPSVWMFLWCFIASAVFLFTGVTVFRSNQDKFVYYI